MFEDRYSVIISRTLGELPFRSRLSQRVAGGVVVADASIKPVLLPITREKCTTDGRFEDKNPGYAIQWRGVPEGVPLELCVERGDMSCPVTHGFKRQELCYLLTALRELGAYGKPVQVWLRVPVYGGGFVESNRQVLRAPVKPLLSPPSIRQIRLEADRLRYLDHAAGDYDPDTDVVAPAYQFAGRLLAKSFDGCYCYMVHGRWLVTHNNFRGFDCITFSASMMGVYMPLPDGTALATGIGAEPCGLESVNRAQILRHCAPGEVLAYHYQQFLAFHAGHTVLIGGGKVFEFSRSRKRFYENFVHMWEGWAFNASWTIRRIPEKFRFKID